MKPDFDKCEKEATRLLLRQDIRTLYIEPRKLIYDKQIVFDTIQNYCKITGENIFELPGGYSALSDGCVLEIRGVYIILYNEEATAHIERLNWTLAHEIGHIYLGHKSDGATEEIEAHWFAAQLLMPEPIIYSIRPRVDHLNSNDLQGYFHVSYEAAQKRVSSLNRKWAHLNGSEEKLLVQKFEPCVQLAIQTAGIMYAMAQ